MDQEDERKLKEILSWAEGHDDADFIDVKAFENMLKRDQPLTPPQKKWVKDIYERVFDEPQYLNLASSGRLVRGREVATPDVLKNLPKKPPRPKQKDDA